MNILHIETSTSVCSVCLSSFGKSLFDISNHEGMNHAALLSTYVDMALTEADKAGLKLDAIAVSSGPGSYTGLRIGVSTAKGLCYGLDVPLISVDTHSIMATQVINQMADCSNPVLFCPMIDARRMEVYSSFFDKNLMRIREVSADIIENGSYANFLDENTVYFFGDGAEKCMPFLSHPNAHFVPSVVPLATAMISLAETAFKNNAFVDVAYFEPFYLKEFQTTIPKNKI